MRLWMLVLLSGLLTACPEREDEELQAYCSSFGTGATFTWGTCTNCTVTNPGLVSDRDLDTASGITPNAGATSDSVTLLASSVADIAGGTTVGVWVNEPQGQTTVGLRTLKDGAQVEADTTQNRVIIAAQDGTAATRFLGMRTTQAFDAVEFTTSGAWASGQTPVHFVYEICSDGGNS